MIKDFKILFARKRWEIIEVFHVKTVYGNYQVIYVLQDQFGNIKQKVIKE